MKNFINKNKGITLIALIITIIVMLILAGISISAIVGEDGIIAQSRKAQIETEKKTLLEQLLTLAEYDNTGKIKVMKTSKNAEEYYKENLINSYAVNLYEKIVTINGKTGKYKYLIKENEIKLIEEDIETEIIEGNTIKFDSDLDGEKEDWIILYKNENNIEVLSTKTMGSLTLGTYDSLVNWNEVYGVANIDNKDGLEKIEKAIYSYNNSINTINNYCKNLIKAENLGVRSFLSNGAVEENEATINESDYSGVGGLALTYGNKIYVSKDIIHTDMNQISKNGLLSKICLENFWLPKRVTNISTDHITDVVNNGISGIMHRTTIDLKTYGVTYHSKGTSLFHISESKCLYLDRDDNIAGVVPVVKLEF